VQLCVDAIEERLLSEPGIISPPSPTSREIAEAPVRALKGYIGEVGASLMSAGWDAPRIVLLIDEFTYLFEYIKEGIVPKSFMRQWKALLELGVFAAVVVGQDSMPKFKQAFPNEFGVTHDERISYLPPESAMELAQQPVSIEGQTRYRGRAIDRLLEYTAGSPFYLQIMCDHLVRNLNRRRRPFVTEADVEQVARILTTGAGSLPIERFDPLITAAGESVAEASRDTYLKLLTSIAYATRVSEGITKHELALPEEQAGLLKDLRERDVLITDAAGRHSIRVGLFSEWLRVNEPLPSDVS
jgi:hypothetical protein